jgi:CubicO group peptidase (beta-lactamase class C family)
MRFSRRNLAYIASLILILSCLDGSQIAGTQIADVQKKDVDKLFSAWDKDDSPGCALGIIEDGKFLYKRGYGMANLEYGLPISSQSVFRIGSTSKQFTAMCILLLQEEGKLTVDDSLKKHFPEMPGYAESITIRHLIHHTSGIRDYLTLMRLAGARGDDFYTDPEVVNLLARQKELNFEPGEEFLYSNSGYFLLSQIVKRVTGKSMRIYAEERIFKPLGMDNTHFHDDHTQIVINRADGYARRRQGGFLISMTNLDMIGDGGVFTTVDDLLLWDQNFYANRLGEGRPELIEKMLTPGFLNSGENTGYAFGLNVSDYKGLKMISHSGGFVGFRADMIRFSEQKLTVVVLANLGAINPSWLARQVADLYLAEQLRIPEASRESDAAPDFITLSQEELELNTGDFYHQNTKDFLSISLRNDRLQARSNRIDCILRPVSRTKFLSVEAPVDLIFEFEKEESNKRSRVTVRRDEGQRTYERVRLEPLRDELLKSFVGDYYSQELDVNYRIVMEDGRLRVDHENPHRPFPGGLLVPKMKDMFTVQGLLLRFDRDEQGFVTALTVDAGRVKNIRFEKR